MKTPPMYWVMNTAECDCVNGQLITDIPRLKRIFADAAVKESLPLYCESEKTNKYLMFEYLSETFTTVIYTVSEQYNKPEDYLKYKHITMRIER